jgi:hypothetical protein
MKKPSFSAPQTERQAEFNSVSRVNLEKLSVDGRADHKQKTLKSDAAQKLHVKDYADNRDARIEARKKELEQNPRPAPQPRPRGVPAERLRTGPEIKAQATRDVDGAAARRSDELDWQKKARQEGVMRKEGLKIERRVRGDTPKKDYEARRAEFLRDRETKRGQERSRD